MRLEAIKILHHFQDDAAANNHHDPITKRFISLMNYDVIGKVRKLCIELIVVNKVTIPHLLGRVRDVDESVQMAAYKKLVEYPHQLKVSHFILLFRYYRAGR